jgi:outer membrane protein OmpA-like peptidoglycan-associated protein
VRLLAPVAVAAAALTLVPDAVAGAPLQVRIDDLRATVRDQVTQVETTETRTERSVAVPSDVLFAFDSARLSREGADALRRVAPDLGTGWVTVTGHTDARGSRAYNRALSLRRARAVAEALAAAVPSLRMRVVGAGEAQPVASDRRAAGRARNRRVEIAARR